jgi:moderate conductance mechanosensitive channel
VPFSPAPTLDALVHTGVQVALIVVVAVLVRAVVIRVIGHASAGAGVPGLVTLLRRRRGITDADRIRAFGSARRAQRARTVGSVIGNAATILIFGTASTMALGQVGVNLAPVLASAGVLGLAVGFGAQNLVRDFLSGIFMLLEDQYGVGDHVDLGDAVGTIERVGLCPTTVRDVAGMVWYVRNGTIERVGNASQDHAVAVVDVPLAIDTDITHAAAVAESAAAAGIDEAGHGADVLGAPQVLGVESLSASGMTLRLTVTTEPGRQWAVQRTVTERVVAALRADEVALAA